MADPRKAEPSEKGSSHMVARAVAIIVARAVAIIAGVVLALIGLGLGVSVVMLPIGLPLGLLGVLLVLGGISVPAGRAHQAGESTRH